MSLNWRQIYIISIGLRFLFGLSNSYIHPDEHFQSLEVLALKFLGYSTTLPWEFTNAKPIRSFGPLYIFYGPILQLISIFNIDISPIGLLYLFRAQLIIVSWLVTDMCLYRILPTKPERIKAVFFTLTSYITLVHQSHTFSNSLETLLLLVTVMIINDLRFELEALDPKRCNHQKLFCLGILVSIGIFNRVTFAAFLILPSIFVWKYIWRFKFGVLSGSLGFTLSSLGLIYIDTVTYTKQFNMQNLIITPLNSLAYNTDRNNLALHGIHLYYTHIIINFPQMLGPGIIFLLYKFKNSYFKTTPFLTMVSGLLFLSLVPHQEARFLIPLLPLAVSCFDFQNIQGSETTNDAIKSKLSLQPQTVLSKTSKLGNWLIGSWYFFNLIMCILMGLFHQGGVIPVLEYTRTNKPDSFTQIWWRTYSPPSWLLGDDSVSMIRLHETCSDPKVLIDAMGAAHNDIYNLLASHKGQMFVAPISSVNCGFTPGKLKLLWKYDYHIDLDHLNFDSWTCLQPGLGIYEIL